MDNELAIIAIKGGRFAEAESIFNTEVASNPTPNSYFGLGICKLNMLLDVNRSVEEVSYCFEKAISIAESEVKSGLKGQAADYLKTVLQQYSSIYEQLEEQKKQEAKAAAVGAALTIGAAMVGSNHKSNAFTQIASLAVAGAGVGVAVDGLANLGKIPDMQAFVIETGEKLTRDFVSMGIISSNEVKDYFDANHLREITASVNESNKQAANKTLSIVLAVLCINRLYLGKWKSGILFLMTVGGYGIWWLMDLIKVIKGEFDPKW